MAKPTKGEMETRINEMYERVLHGYSTHENVRFATDKWKITRRQVETYLTRVYKIIRQDGEKLRNESLAEHYTKLELARKEAIEDGDKRLARILLKDIGEIKGHYNHIQKLDVNSNAKVTLKPATYQEAISALKPDEK